MSAAVALERQAHDRWPAQQVAYGVDAKGPWARIGDITARARPGVEDALRAAIQKAAKGGKP